MICKYFTPILFVLFAVTISQVFCDTRGLYQQAPTNHQQQHSTAGLVPTTDNFYEPQQSNAVEISTPRFGIWNPFEFLTLGSLVQPVVTFFRVLLGLCGFLQISNWVLNLVAPTESAKNKPIEKNTTEPVESNDVDARRKRMLSVEETERTIEAAEKKFGQ